ncbi:MAG TPA: HlyC/CorC family transporter [Clostridiaceae bacterium]|nr:HlyC/CorC family transporter [Clostridiaceae bacterium]
MDSDSWIRVILLVVLALGAAYCAATEISYAALNKIRIKNYADNGDKRAIKALEISENFDQALTTLLISNNITHIGFGSLAALIAARLWGVQAVKYTTLITAVFIFLFSEMIPKSYAKAHSEKYALAVAGSLQGLMKILAPVSFFFSRIGSFISRFFPESKEPAITEEELYDIIETVQEEGVLDGGKQELLNSALKFNVKTAGEILTKRNDIVALDANSTRQEVLQKIKSQKFSRMPVYRDNIDNIIGILHVRTFLKAYMTQESFNLEGLLLQPYMISEKTPIDDLLREMSGKKIHMAIVNDDSGRTLGIVTMEDILEELVGEIWDEKDAAKQETVRLAKAQNKKDGSLPAANRFVPVKCN